MIFFKKYKEKLLKQAMAEALENVSEATIAEKEMLLSKISDLRIAAHNKSREWEKNIRTNMRYASLDAELCQTLTQEVAGVIDRQAAVYGYRIAKGKREELAEDILVSLSIEKK